MTNISEDLIYEALKKIEDPSQSKDIVSLGLINNITVKDSNVAVTLEVPVHRGASMEPIRKLAQETVLNIKGVTSATVVVTAHENKEKTSTFDSEKEEKELQLLLKGLYVGIGMAF